VKRSDGHALVEKAGRGEKREDFIAGLGERMNAHFVAVRR
jgi:hypothetical protein